MMSFGKHLYKVSCWSSKEKLVRVRSSGSTREQHKRTAQENSTREQHKRTAQENSTRELPKITTLSSEDISIKEPYDFMRILLGR